MSLRRISTVFDVFGTPSRDVLDGYLDEVYNAIIQESGQVISVADTGVVAGTEFSVDHDLDAIPRYITLLVTEDQTDAYLAIKPGGTAWTASTIYLKCNTDNAAFTIKVRR